MAASSESDVGNTWLVALGLFLIGAALALWLWPETLTPSVVTERTTRAQSVTTTGPTVRHERTCAACKRTSSVVNPGDKKTITTPFVKTTQTQPASTTRKSETLTLGLLALGFICVLAGSPNVGLASITGPGGIGASFRQEATGTLTAVEKLVAKHEDRLGVVEPSLTTVTTNLNQLNQHVEKQRREIEGLSLRVESLQKGPPPSV